MSDYLMTADAVVITGPTLWDHSKGPRPEEDTTSFSRAQQVVREGFATLNANPGDIGELISTFDAGESGYMLAPATLGQIIMAHLIPDDQTFPTSAKKYWLEVAEYMGPDYITTLRKVAAFMDRVEGFR